MEKPIDSLSIDDNVRLYMKKNNDIGVSVRKERGKVVGFEVWAKKEGAGYTGMDGQIKSLATGNY